MLIVAGHATVDPKHRNAYVEAMQEVVERARSHAKCLDVWITADPLDGSRVNVFERWETREDLDAWREVANPPDTGIEMRENHVKLYETGDARPPFGG